MSGEPLDCVDHASMQKWVRRVWISYIALAVSVAFSLYIVIDEHNHRITDNQHAIELITKVGKAHAIDDRREANAAIAADCRRTNEIRHILLDDGAINSEQGKADLINWVTKIGSRRGCELK